MNERITIEKNTTVVDKIGNHVNTWEEYSVKESRGQPKNGALKQAIEK